MRRPTRSSIALFAATLLVAVASAAASIAPAATSEQSATATFDAIALIAPGSFEQ